MRSSNNCKSTAIRLHLRQVCVSVLLLFVPAAHADSDCVFNPRSIEDLGSALKSPNCDAEDRDRIIAAIRALGPAAQQLIPNLLQALHETPPPHCDFHECYGSDLVQPVLQTLAAIGPAAAEQSIPHITPYLFQKSSGYLIGVTFETLAAFKSAALPALPDVLRYLAEQPVNQGLRSDAIKVITAIGPGAGSAKTLLWKIVQNRDDTAQDDAATALAAIDPEDEELFKFLMERLAKNEVGSLMEIARSELARRTEARAIPQSALFVLRDALLSNYNGMTNQFLAAISTLGPKAIEIRPDVLRKASQNANSPSQAQPFFDALGKMGALPQSEVKMLCPFIDSNYTEEVKAAIDLIEKPLTASAEREIVCCNVHSVWGAIELYPASGAAVFTAAQTGDPLKLEQAIAQEGNADLRTTQGDTLLIYSTRAGRLDWVKSILKMKPTLDLFGVKGKTALIAAVESSCNSKEMVELLLSTGAKPAIKDCSGKTALDHAVALGKSDLISLLSGGDRAKEQELTGYSDLVDAIKKGRRDVLANATQSSIAEMPGGRPSLLMVAVKSGQYQIAKDLVERNVPVQEKDERGDTIVVQLASEPKAVSLLASVLSHGGDATVASANGWYPLHIAASGGHKDIVQTFLAAKGELAKLDSDKHSVLGEALTHSHYELGPILLAAGAKVDQADLIRAAEYAAGEVSNPELNAVGRDHLRYLFGLGLKASTNFNNGWDLIHYAIWGGDVEFVKELIERGADPTSELDDGRTPLALLEQAKMSENTREAMRKLLMPRIP